MQDITINVQTLSSTGTTTVIPVYFKNLVQYPPSVLAFVSSGGSLTYSVEVTNDDLQATGYSSSTGNWQPFSASLSGQTASALGTLNALITGVRLHVTAYSSGSVTLQVAQASG